MRVLQLETCIRHDSDIRVSPLSLFELRLELSFKFVTTPPDLFNVYKPLVAEICREQDSRQGQ